MREIKQKGKDNDVRTDWNRRETQIDAEKAQQIYELRAKDIQLEKEQLRAVKNEIAHEKEKYEIARKQEIAPRKLEL